MKRRKQTARTFKNPVIPGFYPDPSVCRVGSDFYLVTSSFEYFPGVPIFHSQDLVHWRQIGHVLSREAQLALHGVRSSGGIYAPTLRHFGGRFYMITTHVGGGGNFYVTAPRASGPWSDPVWLDREGIDPSLLFADGVVYYTRNGKGADFDHPLIYQGTIDLKQRKIARRLEPIWSGTGGIWPEAPHLYKIGTSYYLLTAEGGTGYGHSVVIARSSTPFGPFEGFPKNPILTHRNRRRHPIQATGHADLLDLEDGSTWAVFLGIRPKSGRHHHLGRETFLAPVTWSRDGWPSIGGGALELELRAPKLPRSQSDARPKRDHFDAKKLSLEWNFLRNPRAEDWSLSRRPGFLRLLGSAVTLDDVDSPALVARRQQHFDARVRAEIDFAPRQRHEEAGLSVRANESFHYRLSIQLGATGREACLWSRLRGQTRLLRRVPLPAGPVVLEIDASARAYAFSVTAGHRRRALGRLPSSALSAESASAQGSNYFTGVYFGMFATGNGQPSTVPADFDWFEYAPARGAADT